MSYISNTDIEDRLGTATYIQLTDDDADNLADVEVVDEARLGAEGEVNSYLARRYEVPIDLTAHAELSGLLATITLDLVEWRLRSRRPPAPSESRLRMEGAVEWLRRIADGVIELPSVTRIAPRTTEGARAESIGEPRLLSRDELAGH